MTQSQATELEKDGSNTVAKWPKFIVSTHPEDAVH